MRTCSNSPPFVLAGSATVLEPDLRPARETRRMGLMRSLTGFCARHPLVTVFVIAIVARAVVAIGIFVFLGGTVFDDDSTYSQVAEARVAGHFDLWDGYAASLYRKTLTFLAPLTFLYSLWGAVELVGQLYVALLGAGVAVLTTRLAMEIVPRTAALLAGLVVALLPSQVFWSSLILKDPTVWLLLAGIAVVAAVANCASGRELVPLALLAVFLLVGLRYVREHTFVIACWALALSVFAGSSTYRLHRIVGGVAICLALPWLVGLGWFGIGLIRGTPPVEERRLENAEGAETAFVDPVPPDPAAPSEATPQEEDSSNTLQSNLEHLPRGAVVLLFEPFPWESGGTTSLMMARAEAPLWYGILALGLTGLLYVKRRLHAALFPLLAGAGSLLAYALAEGNVGTAYRHRGEFVWVVAVLAAMGFSVLRDRRSGQSNAPGAPRD